MSQIKFDIAGATKQERQRLLEAIYYKDPPFDNLVLRLVPFDTDSGRAIAVLANEQQLGIVPRNVAPQLIDSLGYMTRPPQIAIFSENEMLVAEVTVDIEDTKGMTRKIPARPAAGSARPVRKSKPNRLKTVGLIAGGVVLLLIAVALFGGGDDKKEPNAAQAEAEAAAVLALIENSPSESPEPTPDSEPAVKAADAKPYEITYVNAKTWTDSIGSEWIQTIVEITNSGSDNLYLSSGSYDIENADGSLMASKTMVSMYPDVLAPGEKGYMYDETTLDEPIDGEITIIPHVNIEKARVDLIRFPVTEDKLAKDSMSGVKLLGRVENTSSEAESLIYAVAFLYDEAGNCIGRLFTIISDELPPGEKIGFEATSLSLPDDVTVDAVANYTIYAYPTQLQF